MSRDSQALGLPARRIPAIERQIARCFDAPRHVPVQAAANAVTSRQPFFHWEGETLVLNVLGKPSSKLDAIGKPKGHQLKISVTAAPVAGRATDHMVRFLAVEFGVASGDIEVVFGRMNVNKQLRIKSPKRLPAVFGQQEMF